MRAGESSEEDRPACFQPVGRVFLNGGSASRRAHSLFAPAAPTIYTIICTMLSYADALPAGPKTRGRGERVFLALLLAALLAAGGGLGSSAHAQTVPDEEPPSSEDARKERLRQQRQEKRENLQPPEQGFLSRSIGRVESFIARQQLVINLPSIDLYGLRPVLGGLRSGAGTTGGLRMPFFRERRDAFAYVEALASLKAYYGVNVAAGYDDAGPWTGYGFARYWHMPEEDYYGIGPDAEEEPQANYRLDETVAGGLAGYEVLPGVLAGAHVSYQTHRYGKGQDETYPTVERVTLPGEVPRRKADVDYLVPGVFVEYDTRNVPYEVAYGRRFAPTQERLRGISLDATSGIYAAVEAIPHLSVGEGDYTYTRFNFEGQQYLPFRNGYQGLALREFLTLTSTPGDNEIPFYEMKTLGGSNTLRGFSRFRFRDRNAILFNVEYRWKIFRPLDLALFVDAGHVFGSIEEMALEADSFELGYGIGFRFKAGQRVIGRVDVARSREGVSTKLELGGLL
ncbi:MAG: hypothetical protein BRD48_07725 [Bacteroidetes bacterium QS_9_68_14]|nr:MAG: hypothetical protein BRD48_07725 [Bacteroidetes bacterium QS_9_68_14]